MAEKSLKCLNYILLFQKKINRDIIFIKSRNIGKDTSTITQYLTAEIEKTISNSQWQNRKEKRKEKKERKKEKKCKRI